MDDRLERVHADVDEDRVGELECDRFGAHLDGLAVGLVADVLERPRDTVDGTDRDSLARGRRDRLVDGRHGPVDVAAAGLGDRPDIGDGVVLDLVADRAGELLATGADGRCRADVRARGHVGEMPRQRDEGAGAGGPSAARRHPDDRRDRRLEEGGDDALGRIEAAAGRIERQDHGFGAAIGTLDDALLDVRGHDVVDDAGRRQDVDVGPGRSVRREDRHFGLSDGGDQQPRQPGEEDRTVQACRGPARPRGRRHRGRSCASSHESARLPRHGTAGPSPARPSCVARARVT